MMKMKGKYMLVTLLVIPMFSIFISASFAQEKTSPGAPAQETFKLTVERLVIGTGVENLEPVGAAESFPSSTERVYCFVEAKDIAADTEIHVVWFHGETKMLETTLTLKAGPRWRTYAHKNLNGLTGTWKVEIKNAKGDLIKDIMFKVE